MDRCEVAVELKHTGLNCAQAVLCAFAEELGMEVEQLKKLGASFGVGMGCMEATCGALIAAEMILGLEKYEGKPILRDASAMFRRFNDMCKGTICKDLKGRDTGKVLCECDDCVRCAVKIIEELDLW